MVIVLLLLLWWTLWFVPRPKTKSLAILWYGITITTLLWLSITSQIAYFEMWYPQRTTTKSCSAYIGPDDSYVISASLASGEMVRVYENYKGWCKIMKQDNTIGWVPRAYLE